MLTEPGDEAGESLAGQPGVAVDVQVHLEVVGPAVELLLRARQDRFVVVVVQQAVLVAAQRARRGPLLHVDHPGDQLQPVPRGVPAGRGSTSELCGALALKLLLETAEISVLPCTVCHLFTA